MTTAIVVLVSIAAVVAAYALWVGIPLWMVNKHPDTPPDTTLPQYLAGHEYELHEELARELTPVGR